MMDIRPLDGDSPADIAVLLPGFAAAMSLALPSDPPATRQLLTRLLQRRHGTDRVVLAAFNGDTAAGMVKLGLDLADVAGPGHGSLWVFPAHRGRGVGRQLVLAAQSALRERGRPLLLVDTPDPAAAAFAARLGAWPLSTTVRNRLLLLPGGLDHGVAAPPVPGFYLRSWIGQCPDDLLESYTNAWGALDERVNGQARPRNPDTADMRAREAEAWRSGHRQYVTAAVAHGTVDVTGYSTLFVRDSPMADAGETFVWPAARRRGLATWIKGSMLATAARENEQLRLVQAFNDVGNDAVLGLNRKIGFTADSHWTTYALTL
jgi:GNAT superfamily N-acetyltransferase